jgi:hypothetical protein
MRLYLGRDREGQPRIVACREAEQAQAALGSGRPAFCFATMFLLGDMAAEKQFEGLVDLERVLQYLEAVESARQERIRLIVEEGRAR